MEGLAQESPASHVACLTQVVSRHDVRVRLLRARGRNLVDRRTGPSPHVRASAPTRLYVVVTVERET